MALFAKGGDFAKVLGGFFELVANTPAVADKLLASKLTIRFKYSDPDVTLFIDCSGDRVGVRVNDDETPSEVTMSMSADIAHKFWFGKVNLMAALTRRQMIAKGPIPKILKLLPAIKPTYAMYPKYLDDNGFGEYNIY